MIIKLLLLLIGLVVVGFIYFNQFNRWQNTRTQGNAYYSLPLQQRQQLKSTIRRHGYLLRPFANGMAAVIPGAKKLLTFNYNGIYGPAGVSSKSVFKTASEYAAGKQDIFVATQMKCGTTWMQQIVYEILSQGNGDFSDQGHGHLYNTCPWIEARQSVSMEDAPLLGDQQKRLIKTHLPTALCPYNEAAKYIYVARHPVSCFASCVDFIEMLAGPFAPTRTALSEWFCSDKMFWQSWPVHVDGWWQWSQQRDNVLFIHFEALKDNPEATIRTIASFLNITLNEQQLKNVLEKSSFQYMQTHEYYFEMAPPNLFSESSNTRFMQSGKNGRHQDVSNDTRETILQFCQSQLQDSDYFQHCPYPDLTSQNTETKHR